MKRDKKKNKWMKGLNKKLIGSILELKPVSVDFSVEYPKFVTCKITTEAGVVGQGWAICSILDRFDGRVGKNKAAGRALKALLRGVSSDRIRSNYEEFPMTWTKRHIERVLELSGISNKSVLIRRQYG